MSPLSPSAAPDPGDRAKWLMLALGWSLYFCFGVVVASLVPVISTIKTELDLSYTQLGIILGAWQLVFIGAAPPAGSLIDRFGPKRMLLAGVVIMALSVMLRGLADGFGVMFAAVALFGVGGPIMAIGLTKLVADWFTGPSRGVASGIYITGAAAGNAVVLALTHPVILPLVGGWREAQFSYAVFVLAFGVVWFFFGRDSAQSRSDRKRSKDGEKGGYWYVMRQRAVWLVIAVGFCGFLTSHGVRNWLPQILETAGIDVTTAGFLAALPALTGIIGSILVLRFATRRPGARKPAMVFLLVLTGLSMLAIMLTEGWLLVVAIALQGFCAAAFAPLMLNTLMEMPSIGAKNTGAAAGLYFSVGEMGGTLGPLLLGIAADLTGTFMAGITVLSFIMWIMIIPALRIRS